MKEFRSISIIVMVVSLVLLGQMVSIAQAQRLNIPSTGMSPAPTAMTPSVADPYAPSVGTYGSSPYGATTPSYGSAPSTYAAPNSTYGATTSPYNAAPASPYGASSNITSPYPGGGMISTVPVQSGSVAGPVPTFQSQVVAPPPTWDPYAPPGSVQSSSILPADYYPVIPTMDVGAATERMQKFLDELRLDYYYLPARGSKRFGTNDLDLSASFAFPFLYNADTPIYVTPGFAFHWWEGPIASPSQLPPDSSLNYLPPRVYDAYLDTAWNPQPTPWFGGELAFRIGVYSDFRQITAESIRYTGHGFMVVTFSPALKAKLGIVYYDRIKIKLLPAGGLVWTPNENVRFDILFPNPMFSRRMTTMGTTDLWLYLRGEYGGGSWVLTPDASVYDFGMDQYDYNDMRAALGVEFNNLNGFDALVEAGVAFERQLVVRSTDEEFSPSTTVFLRVGVTY